MKQLLGLYIAIILVLCGACTPQPENAIDALQMPSAESATTPSPSKSPSVKFEPWTEHDDVMPMIMISWAYYETLADLCELTANIAVATVDDITVDIQKNETLSGSGMVFSETKVAYTVSIEDAIKGDISAGATLAVYQSGWQLDDINIWHPDMPLLEIEKTYLLFFNEHINVPFESYPEISDGVLRPHERSRFFYDGMKANDAIAAIKQEVERQAAPGKLLIQQCIEDLSQRLSHIPEQIPVRDLNEAEIQAVYNFAGDSRVIGTAGKLLKNGDIFIWVKTQKLSRQQTEDLENALTPAAEQAVDGTHCKVTCTPFHSMVSICKYNEDNATIHSWFWEMVKEPA